MLCWAISLFVLSACVQTKECLSHSYTSLTNGWAVPRQTETIRTQSKAECMSRAASILPLSLYLTFCSRKLLRSLSVKDRIGGAHDASLRPDELRRALVWLLWPRSRPVAQHRCATLRHLAAGVAGISGDRQWIACAHPHHRDRRPEKCHLFCFQ